MTKRKIGRPSIDAPPAEAFVRDMVAGAAYDEAQAKNAGHDASLEAAGAAVHRSPEVVKKIIARVQPEGSGDKPLLRAEVAASFAARLPKGLRALHDLTAADALAIAEHVAAERRAVVAAYDAARRDNHGDDASVNRALAVLIEWRLGIPDEATPDEKVKIRRRLRVEAKNMIAEGKAQRSRQRTTLDLFFGPRVRHPKKRE